MQGLISGSIPFCYTFAAMLKKIPATLLLLAFVVQTFSAPFIRLDYFFNRADYARNCVNKARPKMNCNGKCQVMKKILEEEKKEQKDLENKMNSKVEVLSSLSFYSTLIIPGYTCLHGRQYNSFTRGHEIKMPRSVFHPPSA